MPYYFTVEGIGEIKCDTIEELRSAVGANAGLVTEVSADKPRKAGAAGRPGRIRKKTAGKSPGTGPKKSWAVAEWHSVKTGVSKNDARAALGKLRKDAPKKYFALVEEFEHLVQWYMGKVKAASVDDAKAALQAVFEEDVDKYKALVEEYERKRKKSDA